jgi:hypothetical protein
MLKADAIVLTVIYLLNSCTSIENAVGFTRHCLAKVPQSVPLAALLYTPRPIKMSTINDKKISSYQIVNLRGLKL